MKSLSDAAFFRVFDALASAGNPGLKRASWDFAAVHWEKERLSLARTAYSIVQEIFTLTHQGRPKWMLLVVKDYWWDVEAGTLIRNIRWSRPMSGRRADIFAWFREQERGMRLEPAAMERCEKQG